MSDMCHCSVRSVRTVPCKLTFPLVICDSVLVPRYEFELLQEHFPREKVSSSAFRSATAAVLCKLKAMWFLLPPSHTFQNFRARLKLLLKLLFRAVHCNFPIVTTCFDFLISFETIAYSKIIILKHCVKWENLQCILSTDHFLNELLGFFHSCNITDLQCK